MLAFLTGRRSDEQPAPATTETTSSTSNEATDSHVVMRFLTQGGATVELRRHTWNERYYCGSQARQTVKKNGFEWYCGGCDMTGASKNLRLSNHGYDEHEPRRSREDANQHAAACRSMPKPTA